MKLKEDESFRSCEKKKLQGEGGEERGGKAGGRQVVHRRYMEIFRTFIYQNCVRKFSRESSVLPQSSACCSGIAVFP